MIPNTIHRHLPPLDTWHYQTSFLLYLTVVFISQMSCLFVNYQNILFSLITLYFSSSGHMLLLTFVRYLITVHPLQSRQHLTVLAVSFCSLSVWVLSALNVCVFYYTFIYMSLKFKFWFQISVNIIVVLFFCAITITLHARKIKKIKNSLSVTRHIFIITKTVLEILFNVTRFIFITFRQCMVLTGFLNYSCNPYIFFISFTLLSRFRKKI